MPPLTVAAAPSSTRLQEDVAEKLDAGVRSGLLRGLHSALVWRSGTVTLERYYTGDDEAWGRPLGTVTFTPETLHDLRSVTKSIVGLLYGIALDRGLVPPPDAPLLAQFTEYSDLPADPRRAQLTILHALNMTLGMEWDEQRSYADPANSERAMEDAPDRNRCILDRPFVAAPGERWIYSGGAVALVGSLIANGSGMTLQDFARQTLFAPLGITVFEWAKGNDGVVSAASGLRLRPHDLLTIGQMVLAGGEWHGIRVVSRAWLDASFRPVADTGEGLKYGRLWWIGEATAPALSGARRWIAGIGNGGQRLFLMPDADLATVVFCGAYNAPDDWITPIRIWREIVLANLK